MAQSVTGPFALHIKGKKNSIDGYAYACHAGAAQEGLCYTASPRPICDAPYEFYFNYTSSDQETGEPLQPGYLTWLLTATGENGLESYPSALYFSPSWAPYWGSNVAPALINVGVTAAVALFFHPNNGTLFLYGGYDDTHFNKTRPTEPAPSLGNISNFHLCYQYTGFYYYRSISWVYTLPPQNPSCQPVDLSLESIS
ncbi:hypothetical protein F5B20DRAFT_593435 [Whalleya microplaca]|nr:hypothetical protein F5B20DRAFT_593435 [Whalleya microplaca]